MTMQCLMTGRGLAVHDFEEYYIVAQPQWFAQWLASRQTPDIVVGLFVPELPCLITALLGVGLPAVDDILEFRLISRCCTGASTKNIGRSHFHLSCPLKC